MTLFEELRRRRVLRLIGAYLVVAWLLVQVVTAIEEPLSLPDWFDTAVIVLLGLGFPIAIIMSWVYDVTPDGVVREDGSSARPIQFDYGKVAFVAVLILGAFLAGNIIRDDSASSPDLRNVRSGLQQFEISLPRHLERSANGPRPTAITPDGQRILVQAFVDGQSQVFSRSIGALSVEPVAGTEGTDRSIAISPDGQSIAFHNTENKLLMKVALGGGIPVPLTRTVETIHQITWGENGTIVYADRIGGGLMSVSSAGGDAIEFTVPDGDGVYKHPSFIPGIDAVAFVIGERSWGQEYDEPIGFVTLDGEVTMTSLRGSSPRVTRDGRLLFFRRNTVWSVDIDLDNLTVTSDPVPVVEDVHYAREGHFDVSAEGTLIYVRRSALGNFTLVWVDRDGNEEPLPFPPARYSFPSVSPDGEMIAVQQEMRFGPDAWTHSLVRDDSIQWTTDEGRETQYLWSPNLEYLYFSASARADLFRVRLAQEGSAERLTNSAIAQFPQALLPDGRILIDLWFGPIGDGNNVGIFDPSDPDNIKYLMNSEYRESHPVLSPDEKLLAYMSNRSGPLEVFVRRFPIVEDEWIRVSASGDNWAPQWAADSQELFYRDVDDEIMYSVRIGTEPELTATSPVALFDASDYIWEGITNYDYDLSREKFLMVKNPPPGSTEDEIVLVQNWPALIESGAQ
jgi:Tol biopolymer transport system component